jgi:hypothetical protein
MIALEMLVMLGNLIQMLSEAWHGRHRGEK